ncbi:putative conserved protein [Nautilia profundicola AmH]|uniref:Conserved protein n=1 Tax=Nautilia profundicola (strain ATCC BAA-1463 / DSM 18972 / AmH) TaxID=598659 RepID=B9L8J8_NAUPA|nr:LIM domain-containing protein [Nautilia profundicola]ACM92888.1 putative conserved protein [Nautilia profundicola AmH]
MGKIILFVLIGAAIYFFFIKSREVTNKDNDENEFVQCSNCGTFVLKKEMKEKNGKLVCKDCYENS